MLKYHPPKSQLWGHRVGKLSAVQLLERSERFLREQTVPARGGEAMSKLSVGWVRDGSDAFPQRVEVLRGALAATPRLSSYSGANREPWQGAAWDLAPDELPMVAACIDETEGNAQEPELEVVCSSLTMFLWKVPGEDPAPVRCGGLFGPYLARPRAVTTSFGFVSLEHYQSIKQYLAEIGLVMLSDKRLRPAKPARAPARRAR